MGAKPSPESSASIGRDYLELSKGERTGNCDCADNEAMQSRRIPYMYDDDFNEDHNPMCLSALVSEYVTTMPPPAGARQPRGRMLRARAPPRACVSLCLSPSHQPTAHTHSHHVKRARLAACMARKRRLPCTPARSRAAPASSRAACAADSLRGDRLCIEALCGSIQSPEGCIK